MVDAETSQPVEGVVVVAHWQLEGGLEGGNNLGQMMVMEAVTDPMGKFSFPAWGPRKVPSGYSWVDNNARLKLMAPEMLFFKSGYEYQRLSNDFNEKNVKGDLDVPLKSDWNGKTIRMVKFKGGLKEYAGHLGFLSTSFESILSEKCGWKNVPMMIIAVDQQSKSFRERGINELPSIESLEARYKNSKSNCGSVTEFFRNYTP